MDIKTDSWRVYTTKIESGDRGQRRLSLKASCGTSHDGIPGQIDGVELRLRPASGEDLCPGGRPTLELTVHEIEELFKFVQAISGTHKV
jgi:hypothetical protein